MRTLAAVAVALLACISCREQPRFQSSEFCFRAWFPGAPAESDADRATSGGLPIRARTFLYATPSRSLYITALKFPPDSFGRHDVPAYFDSSIRSHARRLGGTVSNATGTTFAGLPARAFSVEWTQEGREWTSQNRLAYANGHSFMVSVSYPRNAPEPDDMERFFESFEVDETCMGRR